MNRNSYKTSIRNIAARSGHRTAIAPIVFGAAALAALFATSPAMAQALEPVVRGATIAICPSSFATSAAHCSVAAAVSP